MPLAPVWRVWKDAVIVVVMRFQKKCDRRENTWMTWLRRSAVPEQELIANVAGPIRGRCRPYASFHQVHADDET